MSPIHEHEREYRSGLGQKTAETGTDRLEETLIRAHGFLEEALRVSRRARRRPDTRVEQCPRDWWDAAASLTAETEGEYVLAVSGATAHTSARLTAHLRAVGELAARGVRVRHLVSARALSQDALRRHAEAAAALGAEVRVGRRGVHDAVIADRRAAVVWGSTARSGEQCLVIRGTVILEGLRRSLNAVWDTATCLPTYQRWYGEDADALAVTIVGMLSAGHKDDTAARRLGMSVRTYRRHVAEILRKLGAESRFQAGARAAQLGLLPGG
ncbi:hypothetical protein Afil01_38820 [Actinorhabdospora filicis]|uniref:HTH luxR-type domain-containing protein n=1 Tax=Actinorhabdospora filicis TaxID=1785913 RepID=A0A9W6SLB9_9ACTN|nr:hypothetical protein [Actinorhabdospora filicis]GLZ79075.1 hypothetical protein Afil01_38820 [Actinorhabdospora filicis]